MTISKPKTGKHEIKINSIALRVKLRIREPFLAGQTRHLFLAYLISPIEKNKKKTN